MFSLSLIVISIVVVILVGIRFGKDFLALQ
jgi:hypothetical protein